MTAIAYTLKVDWANDGAFSNAYSDVSARVLEIPEIFIGRDQSSQLRGGAVAGRLMAVLRNNDGRFSRFNSASPIYGFITPGIRIRLMAGTSTFPWTFPVVFNDNVLWEGWLDNLIPSPGPAGYNEATLTAYGSLARVAARKVYAAQQTNLTTDTAIGAILDAVGWSSSLRTLSAGKTTMTRWWAFGDRGDIALRDVEKTENGFIRETKGSPNIIFEDRHYRLSGARLTSQATFSDAAGATINYEDAPMQDPLKDVVNIVKVRVRAWSAGAAATLWTLAESGASSPVIGPGDNRIFVAVYPLPNSATQNVAVSAWTLPLVAGTDYVANSAADGSGTVLTASIGVSVTATANALFITLTNNAGVPAYITLLQARGTPLQEDTPVEVEQRAASSITSYGQREYESAAPFVPNTGEAQDYGRYLTSIFGDPIAPLALTFSASKDANHAHQALIRDISDRITIVAANQTRLGINGDYFIEAIRHSIDRQHRHTTTFECSPIGVYGNVIILDYSPGLDTGILGY